ncbi:hypothetical protein BT69DRAFT_1293051 [Atractiella rhizophila]|nr:hypothetical protein BT69DRAFT_1293051 [Atractiella rhizophila]
MSFIGSLDLKEDDKVHLETDIWTSVEQMYMIMGTIGHFIDQDWNRKQKVLRATVLQELHNAPILAKQLTKVITNHNLVKKFGAQEISLKIPALSISPRFLDKLANTWNTSITFLTYMITAW